MARIQSQPGKSKFEPPLQVLAVVGSLNKTSVTRAVVREAVRQLEAAGCAVDTVDFIDEPLPLFDPESAFDAPHFAQLKARVDHADVLLLGTPDYHGSISSAMKNFLDHFWREFAGKLFATMVASHEKGLTVTDQLRTVARQCYAWSLPYGLSFIDRVDVDEGRIVSDGLKTRLRMMVRDIRVYGELLARQRCEDLTGTEEGFLARLRK
jgi:NAD(P)H-dependent FMN reductase